jgi:hypothetical protein
MVMIASESFAVHEPVYRLGVFLGKDSWTVLAQAARTPCCCVLDMGEVAVAYPPGAVALMLALEYRAKQGLLTQLHPPRSADVLNYLERIDLFRRAAAFTKFSSDVSGLSCNRRNASALFTELLAPRDDGVQTALNVVENFVRRHGASKFTCIYTAMEETLGNVDDHSLLGHGVAESYAQVQVYRGWIEIALGDLGVGFRASLAENPELPAMCSERDALRAALVQRYSRLSHVDSMRGGGLRQALSVVAKSGGAARVQSHGATAIQCHGQTEPLIGSSTYHFPGTLLHFRIPKQRS